MIIICGQKDRSSRRSSSVGVLISLTFFAIVLSGFTPLAAAQNPGQDSGSGPTSTGSAIRGSMTIESLITFLERHSDQLSMVRAQMAQLIGVDPSTVTDAQVFDRVRQDPALASKVIHGLERHGYSLNGESNFSDNPAEGVQTQLQTATASPTAVAASASLASGGQNSVCPAGYAAQSVPSTTAPTTTATQQLSAQALPTVTPASTVCVPAPAGQGNVMPAAPPPPAFQQRQVPYGYMTSLTDLYTQVIPPDNAGLQRFGTNVFVLGTGNTDALPMDLPAGPDYVLGTGDTLNLNIWGSQSITLGVVIDRQGQIALPESGSVEISGLTIAEAQKVIQQNLHTQYKDMHVELSLGRVRTVRVYVVGDVQRPGAFDISSLSTPLNALYAAGGPTSTGSMRILRHYRGKQMISEVDLYDFLLRGIRTTSERLLPGDTLLVPPVGTQVTVNGIVRRPGIYELKEKETLKDALELAGGILVTASLGRLNVERIEANQRRTMLSIQTSGSGKNALDAPDVSGFYLQDGDAIQIRPILPYNEAVVYLDGHVYRPGKYPFREGMTVNDLLHSNRDLMPEPADRLELIRLEGADYHPVTTLLNLLDVLHGNSPILLKPFDYLRAFSRYEVDPPKVVIAGEVIRPGDYPMSAGMKASDLVRMAGGLRRSAYRDEADLATYEVQNGKSVRLETRVIQLQKAMDGDASADATLQPGEVLGIREISGWHDIGSAVAVSGEIAHPGTYGILPGERLSSLLKRAGGFRELAFPQGIILQRSAARALQEKARQDIIQRIESIDLGGRAFSASLGGNSQDSAEVFQMMRAQQRVALAALRASSPSGRVVVKIGPDISRWENTPADIQLSADDTIFIPKQNEIVSVVGQVYEQTALAYTHGKDAGWYLRQAGGATHSADRGEIYVIRADGSHISRRGFLSGGGVLSMRPLPGDTIVVPEKIGGPGVWKTVFEAAQAMTAPLMLSAFALK
jgi:protein involved in polysaccharide export with SLBB domain